MSQYKVCFVRGFGTDEQPFADLANRFGELSVHPLHQFQGKADRTVTEIRDTQDKPPAGFPWHTDLSWLAEPPRFGYLQALDIPPVGGDTTWASMVSVYESLSLDLQKFCSGLTAVHKIDPTLLKTVVDNHGEEAAADFREAYGEVRHPLVRAHPDTGAATLYLSPMYLDRIDDLAPGESEALLNYLNDLAAAPEFVARWRWRQGDLVIWDESCTLHRALPDHYPQFRRMRRCTIAGNTPEPFRV